LNPCNPEIFPWLSAVASSFQEFRWIGLCAEFRTLCSDIPYISSGASITLGSVCLATNYNANAEPYNSIQAALNSEFADSSKPSISQCHYLECAPSQTPNPVMYCSQLTAPGAVNDNRMNSLGTFQVITDSLPVSAAGSLLGQLWIEYELALFKPVLEDSSLLLPFVHAFNLPRGSNAPYSTGSGTAVATNVLGTNAVSTFGGAINPNVPSLSGMYVDAQNMEFSITPSTSAPVPAMLRIQNNSNEIGSVFVEIIWQTQTDQAAAPELVYNFYNCTSGPYFQFGNIYTLQYGDDTEWYSINFLITPIDNTIPYGIDFPASGQTMTGVSNVDIFVCTVSPDIVYTTPVLSLVP